MMAPPEASDDVELDAVDADAVEQLPIGFVVGGRYVIRRLLGMGGNGAVYEGEHADVGHRVAIKVVHRELAERQDVMNRFRHEARVCGSLRHANIGQVYDIGTLDNGSPYMVMELQEGRSLAEVIHETKLPIAAVLDIARQLLAGLGAAHQMGVIHRDVKPDNVMIVRDHAGDAVVKLVDFGISTTLGDTRRDTGITGEGTVIGSPDYMSPEQLRGERVDVRTDLYSTGVLLYEAITGHLPFEQQNLTDLVVAVMRDPVKAPTKWRIDCPVVVERVVLKAMAREPSDRYASTAEMSRALAEAERHARQAPALTLAHLSEPPPIAGPSRRIASRTIDSITLESVRRDALGRTGIPGARRNRVLPVGIAAASLLALLGIGLAMGGGSRAGGTTAIEPSEPLAAPAPAEPSEPLAAQAPAEPAVPADEGTPNVRAGLQAEPEAEPPPPVDEPAPAAAGHEPSQTAEDDHRPSPARKREAEKPRTTPRDGAKARKPAPAPEPPPAAPTPQRSTSEQLREASALFIQGRTREAHELYRQIVRQAPGEATAWRGVALTAGRLGDDAAARRALDRYRALRPGAPDIERIERRLAGSGR